MIIPSSISSFVVILLIFLRVANLGFGILLFVNFSTTFFVNSPEIVSTDFYSSPFASIIDSQATITSDKRLTLYCWYDNEYGYTKQVIGLAKKVAKIDLPRLPIPIT